LTKDEILAMEPGRELDALVAEKIFGLKYKECIGCYIDSNGDEQKIQRHSTEIAAAWEVVEKMYIEGFRYTINILDDWRFEKPTQHCCFAKLKPDCTDGSCTKSYDHFHAYGDTVPGVVCKAALLAVGEASND